MNSATMLNFTKSLVSDEAELMKEGSNQAPLLAPARTFVQDKDGTPGMANAALGTAHEVRVRRAEQWAAARMGKIGAGTKSRGRSRGKGAQLPEAPTGKKTADDG